MFIKRKEGLYGKQIIRADDAARELDVSKPYAWQTYSDN